MCGIFGFSITSDKKLSYDDFQKDIGTFVKDSKKRGSDSFGLSTIIDGKVYLYKTCEEPMLAIKKNTYKKFQEKNIKNKLNNIISTIGQTRLVTNGSKFSYENNQPIETENIIGVHNGIFTNLEKEIVDKTKNFESFNVESDSSKFYKNLSKLILIKGKNNYQENIYEYLKIVEGNFSIAFHLTHQDKIFISSNCGSLYYYHFENYFVFSSEKNFLQNFLKKSKMINKSSLDNKNIKNV